MIELTPRPGGDCLPPLLLKSAGMDIIGCTLDLAEGREIDPPKKPSQWRTLVGARVFATVGGEIEQIDPSELENDGRVVEYYLKRSPGHHVIMPPKDYDSRLIGHVIFQPSSTNGIREECLEIALKLKIKIKAPECKTAKTS